MKKHYFLIIATCLFVSIYTNLIAVPVDYIKVSYDAQFPMGTAADAYKYSSGFGLQIGKMLTPNWGVNLSASYTSWSFKQDPPANSEWSFSTIPIQLGGKYAFDPCGHYHSYFGLQAGIALLKDSYSYKFNNQTFEQSNSETKFILSPIIGTYYDICDDFAIDLNIKYNMIFNEPKNFNYLGVSLGVGYNLKGVF